MHSWGRNDDPACAICKSVFAELFEKILLFLWKSKSIWCKVINKNSTMDLFDVNVIR